MDEWDLPLLVEPFLVLPSAVAVLEVLVVFSPVFSEALHLKTFNYLNIS